jgi:hypothetical protein
MRKEESAHKGQKIRTESNPDKSSHKVNMNEALSGREMKGGPTDLSHSLKAGAYGTKKSKA